MEQNENMTSVVIEQEGENKKRSALAVILALAVVVILGIGTTFAFLAYTGNQTPNRFTTDAGISCDLLEPAWTAAVNDAKTDDNGWPSVASDGKTIIPTAANNTQASSNNHSVIAKDPFVVNTSTVGNEKGGEGVNEYVGIRLTFQKWVADGNVEGSTSKHTEEGKYVTMTGDEVKKLLSVYAFTTEDSYSSTTKAGFNLGKGWVQCEADGSIPDSGSFSYSGNYTYNEDGSAVQSCDEGTAYFVYTNAIRPLGQFTQDTNPEGTDTEGNANYDSNIAKAVTADDYAAADPNPTDNDDLTTTTTNLFNNVIHVAEKDSNEYKDLVDVLYKGSTEVTNFRPAITKNGTQDPGWRVLVSTAAIDATTSDVTALTVSDGGEPAAWSINTDAKTKNTRQAINAAHVAIQKDGKSATISGRTSGKGTGFRAGSSVPEDSWNY